MKPKILITRPQNEARELAFYLENKGFEAIIEPIFSVKSSEITEKFAENEIQAIILTSIGANEAFLAANFAKNVKIFTIGEKTAQKLLQNGYENVIFPKISNFLALKELILENCDKNKGKILYFCGNFITFDFAKWLESEGFLAQKILAYKIEYKDSFSSDFLNKIKSQKIDYVLVFSKNAAKNLYFLVKNHNLLEYFEDSMIIGFSDEIMRKIKEIGFKNFGNFREISALKNFYNL